jgi:hypothetical protein
MVKLVLALLAGLILVAGAALPGFAYRGEPDFSRSLIYSGGLALAVAVFGLAIVGWRRRQW